MGGRCLLSRSTNIGAAACTTHHLGVGSRVERKQPPSLPLWGKGTIGLSAKKKKTAAWEVSLGGGAGEEERGEVKGVKGCVLPGDLCVLYPYPGPRSWVHTGFPELT